MKHNYFEPILFGFVTFPILAFIFTLPYIFHQYRKYGSIPKSRTIIIYSFILYLLCAYYLVILPLPSFNYVNQLTTPTVQLTPFGFISDIINKVLPNITSIKHLFLFVKNPVVYQVLYNILLTLPFGIYLKYYFKKKMPTVIFYTFILSLFFEITQFTGLYHIYPRGYRLFDIDDLIINTFGGFLGYLIEPIFTFVLPSRNKIDLKAYKNGEKIYFIRRFLAFSLDFIFFGLFNIAFIKIFNLNKIFNLYHIFLFTYVFYFIILGILLKYKTIGKKIMRLKIANITGEEIKVYQYLKRYVLYYVLYLLPINIYYIHGEYDGVFIFLQILIVFIIFLIVVYVFYKLVIKKEHLFYEKYSNTRNISTIEYSENEFIN